MAGQALTGTIQLNRSKRRKQSHFPLTPALSLRERGNPSQLVVHSMFHSGVEMTCPEMGAFSNLAVWISLIFGRIR